MSPINALAESKASIEAELKSGSFENFIDETFEKNMAEFKIPGAVISVVKDGKEVFSKGYGYSDAEAKIKADPSKTLFRIGSITKTFTETAAMQLVEKGKIDLNADVNGYLKGFNLENPYSTPVTMAELLTHTSGLDSDEIGDLTHEKADTRLLNDVLSKRMLPVIRQPGKEIDYCNYGITLAGCIVENVSGESCREYITNNILSPLNMTNTSFTLEADALAQGYNASNGNLERRALNGTFILYPVGGLVSTADDMAKYMAAHLNYGTYDGKKILNEDTSKLMQSRHAGFDEHLPGTCYGFYERFINGERTIGHAGYSVDGFLSEMCLLPQYGVGVFIAINQGSNNSFPQDFMKDFISRYYSSEVNASPDSSGADSSAVAGSYRFGEYTKSTIAKADIFGAGEGVKVTANPDGSISLNGIDSFTGEKYTSTAVRITGLVYQKENGDYIVFKSDESGKVKYMAQTQDSWHGTYEKISWYDENSFQIGLFITLLALSLFVVIVWLIYLIRRIVKKDTSSMPPIAVFSMHTSGISSLLNISFFVISIMTWGDRLRYGVPLDAKLLLCIPMANCLFSIFLAVACFLNLKYNKVSRFYKVIVLIAALSSIVFTWFYNYWNFLGFRF
jgi:Beta-lactamase class C and other penicillin binding proteins